MSKFQMICVVDSSKLGELLELLDEHRYVDVHNVRPLRPQAPALPAPKPAGKAPDKAPVRIVKAVLKRRHASQRPRHTKAEAEAFVRQQLKSGVTTQAELIRAGIQNHFASTSIYMALQHMNDVVTEHQRAKNRTIVKLKEVANG